MLFQIWRCVRCLSPRVWGLGNSGDPGLLGTVYLTCEGCSGEVRFGRHTITRHTPHTFWRYKAQDTVLSLRERMERVREARITEAQHLNPHAHIQVVHAPTAERTREEGSR